VLKNVTITLEEDALRRVRIRAAEEGTSVSKLIGALVEREIPPNRDREEALNRLMKLSRMGFRSKPGFKWNREEAHERRR
jgi:hypothetical protein